MNEVNSNSNDTTIFSIPIKVANGTKKRVRKLQEKWTSQQTQKLIREVEIREGTWNSLAREYRDRNSREALWQEVADVMELPRSEVATKWNSLRCSFRAIFNKMGQTKRIRKADEPNSLYNSLKFLEKTIQIESPTTSNLINKYSRSISPISPSDAETHIVPDNPESTSSRLRSSIKRRRVEKSDEYKKVVERASKTLTAPANYDIWDDLGKFISSNGREWAAENSQLAKEFKIDICELVSNYQKRISTQTKELTQEYSEKTKVNSPGGSSSELYGFEINNVETLAEGSVQDDAQLRCENVDENLHHSVDSGHENLFTITTSCDPLEKLVKTEAAENNLSTYDHNFSGIENDSIDEYLFKPEFARPPSTDDNVSSSDSHDETELKLTAIKAAKIKAETRYFNEMADYARSKREFVELQKKRF